MAEQEATSLQDGCDKNRKMSLQLPEVSSRRSSRTSLASGRGIRAGSESSRESSPGSLASTESDNDDGDRKSNPKVLEDLKHLELLDAGRGDEYYSEVSDDEMVRIPEEKINRRNSVMINTLNKKEGFYSEDDLNNIDIVKEIDEQKLQELENAFELFDMNGDGLITIADLKSTFITLGEEDISEEELKKMLDDGDKPLDLDAFVKMVGSKTLHLDPEHVVTEALAKWDCDKSGLIPIDRIRHDLMSGGDRFSSEELDMALIEAPIIKVKGKEMLEYQEFCQMLCSTRKKQPLHGDEDIVSV